MLQHVIPLIDQCVGCENCKNICKKDAISFLQNDEGFFYPIVDENKCINCGACNKVCPIYQTTQKNETTQVGYATISRIKALYRHGASAGAFGTIAHSFLENFKDSLVVGVACVDGVVKHVVIDKIEDVALLQNSKYVQSKMGDVVIKVSKALKNGKYVLFSGTPCQVNAVKSFVGKECSNLFTIDLICHGVPSPALLKFDLQKQGFCSIQDIKFRLKTRKLHSRSHFLLSIKGDGKTRHIFNNRDLYYQLFIKEGTYRETCYKCKFANLSRVGDITIGDCDSHKYIDFHQEDALNAVLINSEKGKFLWMISEKDLDSCQLNLEKEAECNTQLRKPCERKKTRDSIYKDVFNSYEELLRRMCKPRTFKDRLILLLKYGCWR